MVERQSAEDNNPEIRRYPEQTYEYIAWVGQIALLQQLGAKMLQGEYVSRESIPQSLKETGMLNDILAYYCIQALHSPKKLKSTLETVGKGDLTFIDGLFVPIPENYLKVARTAGLMVKDSLPKSFESAIDTYEGVTKIPDDTRDGKLIQFAIKKAAPFCLLNVNEHPEGLPHGVSRSLHEINFHVGEYDADLVEGRVSLDDRFAD